MKQRPPVEEPTAQTKRSAQCSVLQYRCRYAMMWPLGLEQGFNNRGLPNVQLQMFAGNSNACAKSPVRICTRRPHLTAVGVVGLCDIAHCSFKIFKRLVGGCRHWCDAVFRCVCWLTQQAHRMKQEQTTGPRTQTSLFARMLRDGPTAATDSEHGDGIRTLEAASRSSFGFAFASAALSAARAVRKSHLSHVVEQADRGRLEREAFRVLVHEHVRRELVRKSIEHAELLGGIVNAD